MIRIKKTAIHLPHLSRILTTSLLATLLPFAQASANNSCYSDFDSKDYASARTHCQSIAEVGDAKAAFLLATIYYQGLDTEQDEQRAIFWDKIAAEKGHPDSAYRLALAYQLGQGVALDNSQARRWYMQAALADHSKAQKQLGAMFETGIAGEVDLNRAFKWYFKAAQQGVADAQLRAGTMLLEGRGTTANRAHAQHWIRKAAVAGNSNAQVALGVMLAETDSADSIAWYRKAAEQGNGLALNNLALVYYTGQGVEQNVETAVAYAKQALAAGASEAKALLARVEIEQQQQRIAQLQTEKQRVAEQLVQSLPSPASGEPALVLASITPMSDNQSIVDSEPVLRLESELPEDASYQMDGWIMEQPANAFTIQLTNGPEITGIQDFITQNQLPETAKYYRTQRQAGIFYVLVYGQYPTVAQAREALNELPPRVRQGHWIRNISQLQGLYRAP